MQPYTKQAIVQSFLKLAGTKPMDKITVKDLVEDCNINRATFYYHFADIYAIVEYLCDRCGGTPSPAPTSVDSLLDGFYQLSDFIVHNNKAIHHIYQSVGRDQLEKYLSGSIGERIRLFVHQQAEGLSISENALDFLSAFYEHAVFGLLYEWMGHDFSGDPRRVGGQIAAVLQKNLRASLENIAEMHL